MELYDMAKGKGKAKKNTGKVSKAVKKYVKDQIDRDQEDKYFDYKTVITDTDTDAAGSVTLISDMTQSIDSAGYIGQTMHLKHLEFMYDIENLTRAPNDAIDAYLLRCIVFRDTQQNNVLPLVEDVLELYPGDTSAVYNAPYNRKSIAEGRFKILYDKLHQLDPLFQDTGIPPSFVPFYTTQTWEQARRKKIKLNVKMVRTDIEGGVSSSEKNNLYVLFISNQAVSTGFSANVNWYSRITFEDA